MRKLEPGPDVDDLLAPYRGVDRPTAADRSWVLANMVAGLDGSAAVSGRVGVLSSETDQALFTMLRSVADVVLVGAETVRRERYGAVRLPEALRAERVAAGRAAVPPLAIVTRSLDLDWSAGAFAEAPDDAPTMVVTCEAADASRVEEARRHAAVLVAGDDRVEPVQALAALRERGARVVLCEGGPTLLGELVATGLLDELCLTVEPLMGGDPLPVAIAPPARRLVRFALGHALTEAGTLFLRYERVRDDEGR